MKTATMPLERPSEEKMRPHITVLRPPKEEHVVDEKTYFDALIRLAVAERSENAPEVLEELRNTCDEVRRQTTRLFGSYKLADASRQFPTEPLIISGGSFERFDEVDD